MKTLSQISKLILFIQCIEHHNFDIVHVRHILTTEGFVAWQTVTQFLYWLSCVMSIPVTQCLHNVAFNHRSVHN